MAIPPAPPLPVTRKSGFSRMLGRTRLTFVLIALAVFILCLGFSWSTRDAMENLPFLKGHGSTGQATDSQKTLVDLRPWQTASTLASLAVTNEEAEYAQEAERLADHEVDQAFAAALREASARVQRTVLTGDALELSQRVAELEQLVKDDKAQVASNTASGTGTDSNGAVS